MTKLNDKPLSEMLEASEPECHSYGGCALEDYYKLRQVAIELTKGLESIMRDMPKKAKEKFDKNEVTYFCKEAGAEVLDHRFEHAIVCRDVLSRAKDILESK